MIHKIIEMFGGLTQISRKTKIPLTTIQGWQRSGKIPYWRHEYLKKKASENGLNIKEYLTGERK